MRFLLIACLLILPVLAQADAHAQVEPAPASPLEALRQDAAAKQAGSFGAQVTDPGQPTALPEGFAYSDETLEAISNYAELYYANLSRGLEHRERVFYWQYMSSIIIFFVVIGIVLIGLYFSWMQFHAKGGEVGETTMEASKEGFKVSSPVLGVIILVLSLAFFYLYLVHVYPISELG